MHFLKLCFLFLFLCSFKLQAQELFFSQPSGFQNLPSLETYHILQDRKGFLWITTDAGICRYDGKELKLFTTKHGLPESVVFDIYEDDLGRIWFSTLSGYFFYYYKEQFHSIGANEQLKTICKAFPPNSFYIGLNDTLYATLCGAAGGVLAILKIPPQHDYEKIILDSTSIKSFPAFIISNPLHPDQILRGSGKRSSYADLFPNINFLYNNVPFKIPHTKENVNANNLVICEVDRHNNVYIVVGKNLFAVSKEGIIKSRYRFEEDIVSCYVDPDNDVWICTNNGGYLLPNGDLNRPALKFLNKIPLSSVFVDREKTVWVATLEKGILQSINKNILFLNEGVDKPFYLQKDSNQVHITFNSKKIVSLLKNDSLYLPIKTNMLQNIPGDLTVSYIDDAHIYLQIETKLLAIDRYKNSTPLFLYNGVHISEIIRIGKDSILFLSPPAIITMYHKKINIIPSPSPFKNIYQLKNKKIIVSSRNNNGIYEFKDDKFIPYLPNLTILKTRINCMTEDAQGNIWFATNEHGLYCYDYKHQLHQYTTTDGLMVDKINTLAIDDHHNLWLGSYGGLTKFSYTKDLEKILVTNFNKNHGIPNLQIEKLIAFNGKIVCIAKSICFYFEESKLKRNAIAPFNYIQSVSINDKFYDPDDTSVLNYDQNNIRVQVSLITYKNTEDKKFLYKLIGYDEKWHTSSTGEIGYTNLPYGHYVLTIYGLNNDSIKSNRPATYAFTIRKPFWFTWWFIIMEIIFFFFVFYFIFRFWKNRIQKREHDKALINQKIAEFKMTALRSQMNPHFVFNAISSIQHYILKQDTFKSYNYLAKFSLLIRTILDNSKEEYIALSQEINTLKLYIELEQIRFKQPFKFILNIDENLEMDTYIPTMLIQPYVENSIWHGLMPKQTNCILEIELQKKQTHILAIIKDNGVGRNYINKKSKLHESKGMSITEQRIKELEQTNERKFQVTIVDLKNGKGEATGTEVQIIIPFDL